MGLFLLLLFLLCFVWYFAVPVERDLHLRLLKLSFLWYQKMDLAGFISGAIQSYVWGYLFTGMWAIASKLSGLKGRMMEDQEEADQPKANPQDSSRA